MSALILIVCLTGLVSSIGARFGTRVSTDAETGIQIFTETGTEQKKHNLNLTDITVIKMKVLEGHNVTMESGVKKPDPDHHVSWIKDLECKGKEIAKFNNGISEIDEDLKTHLSLDPKSGSLTISNIIKELSGFYCVKGPDSYITKQYHIIIPPHVVTLNVSKGDDVTMKTKIQIDKHYDVIWIKDEYCNGNVLAKCNQDDCKIVDKDLKTHLSLDPESGSLAINNTIKALSGFYCVRRLLNKKEYSQILYYIRVCDTTLKVLKGNNMTMKTEVQQLDPDDSVIWTGPTLHLTYKNGIIVNNNPHSFSLEPKSGSVTNNNITDEHSGFYLFTLEKDGREFMSLQFNVAVYGPVSTPHISKSHDTDNLWSCQVTCSVVNKPNLTLTLYKGDTEINSTSSSDLSTVLSLSLDVHSPSEDTYRCEAANPVSEWDVSLNTTDLCPTPHPGISKAVILVVAVLVAAVFGVLVWRRRRSTCTGCVETQDQNSTHELSYLQG